MRRWRPIYIAADRRPVELKNIEFVNTGNSVPILVAITGVLEW